MIRNFLVEICGCSQNWTPASFVQETVEQLKQQIGDGHVIMALSGGVDSTVAATLIHKAIGNRLHGIFVDNGVLRKDEFQQVLDMYHQIGLNVKGIDAKTMFYDALAGKSDPEEKRKKLTISHIHDWYPVNRENQFSSLDSPASMRGLDAHGSAPSASLVNEP